MKRCPYCGKLTWSDYATCVECGALLSSYNEINATGLKSTNILRCYKCGSTDVSYTTSHYIKKGAAKAVGMGLKFGAEMALAAISNGRLGKIYGNTGFIANEIKNEYQCNKCGYIFKSDLKKK